MGIHVWRRKKEMKKKKKKEKKIRNRLVENKIKRERKK